MTDVAPTPERSFVVALGSNLGDRHGHLRAAIQAVSLLPGTRVERVSQLRETAPVGGPPQGRYLNGALLLTTSLAPLALLDALLTIERDNGRERRELNGPRTLDLDLLWSPGLTVDGPRLCLPHPRLPERRFALEPLVELVPDARDPHDGALYAERLASLPPG